MSENDNVNTNDLSDRKILSDKKIFQVSGCAAETETRAEGTTGSEDSNRDQAVDTVSSPRTLSEFADSREYVNKLSGEERHRDIGTETMDEEKCGEQGITGASLSASSAADRSSGSVNEPGVRVQDDHGDSLLADNGKTTGPVPAAGTAESAGAGCEEYEVQTSQAEESLEKLKMNIDIDEDSTCVVSGQSVSNSPSANLLLPNHGSSEQNTPVELEDHTEEKQNNLREEDNGPKPDPESEKDSMKTDEHNESTDAGVCPGSEGGESNQENDNDVVMKSPEASQQEGGDEESGSGQSVSGLHNSDAGDKQKEGGCLDMLPRQAAGTSGRAKDSDGGKKNTKGRKEKKSQQASDADALPSRLARITQTWAERDTQQYRDGYPGKEDYPRAAVNLQFYQGKVNSEPHGDFIDEIHKHWWKEYDLLEDHHGYIQWLFPIRETGMNFHAEELQLREAQAIMADERAMVRFKKSYEMMLNFYGIRLISAESGEVERARNWRERFRHLNGSSHNYLRITRILKCLGELGLERFKAPFLRFMLYEALITGSLHRTLSSCYNYWIGTVRDDEERHSIKEYAKQLCLQAEEFEKK